MAYQNNIASLEKMLLNFLGEPDPMLSMPEWLCRQMMEVAVENKLGASVFNLAYSLFIKTIVVSSLWDGTKHISLFKQYQSTYGPKLQRYREHKKTILPIILYVYYHLTW